VDAGLGRIRAGEKPLLAPRAPQAQDERGRIGLMDPPDAAGPERRVDLPGEGLEAWPIDRHGGRP
jgi:hypothetical protein